MTHFKFIFFFGALFSACSPAPTTQTSTSTKDTLIVAVQDNFTNLNWNRNSDTATTLIVSNVMEGLTRLDLRHLGSEPQPGLASQWTTSSDGLKTTFHLKEKLKWSDGQKLKAEQFVFALENLLSPSNTNPNATLLFAIKNAKAFKMGRVTSFSEVGVSAPDDLTVIFTLEEKQSHFAALFAQSFTFPMRRDLVLQFGEHWADLENIVTIGSYLIAKPERKRAVFLKRNDAFEAGPRAPKTKNVICYFSVKAKEALKLFNAGQLDVLYDIQRRDVDIFRDREELESVAISDVTYLAFDVRQKPFSNPIFRRAVGMAIERHDVARAAGGNETPIGEMIPPGFVGYESNRGVRFDADAASDLLKHSGYSNLEKFRVKMIVPDNQISLAVADNVKAQLKKNLGLDVLLGKPSDLIAEDGPAYKGAKIRSARRATVDSNQEALFYLASQRGFAYDPDIFLSIFRGKTIRNITSWKNRNYEDLLSKALQSDSNEAKSKIYAKAQHILNDQEMPVVPLFVNTNYSLIQKRVTGFPLNGFRMVPFRLVTIE